MTTKKPKKKPILNPKGLLRKEVERRKKQKKILDKIMED